MTKHKVSELEGALLDAAVADLELCYPWREHSPEPCEREITDRGWMHLPYHPSTEWAQGGPIIERERILLSPLESVWHACHIPSGYAPITWKDEYTGEVLEGGGALVTARGPTPLIAAMRAYVASTFGDEVDLP